MSTIERPPAGLPPVGTAPGDPAFFRAGVMSQISNPILPGFHPDPCIIRAGEYYYIATSTFEWWPGVRLHRSRDLGTWELVGYALTRKSQIDLRGNPDSGGVWAPALSFCDNKFWLIYSDVKSHAGPFKDVRNYLITADRIEGPWSEPVALNRSGFDPSLFHDADGRKWLVNQLWDNVSDAKFAGILLQEFSVAENRLIGEPVNIFPGTELGLTEGPHLYRKDGYYYLVTAEGGTEWTHAVTIARSRTLTGPYEASPSNPLLTSADNPANPLQKAGHGSFVQAPDGHWFLAHLCGRPVGSHRRCILGRETALQPVVWPDGDWPRLQAGGHEPAVSFALPGVTGKPYLPRFDDDFDSPALDLQWNTLREPSDPSWLTLTERPGFLRLRGRETLQSVFDQSLVGFRLLHHQCTIETRVEYSPRSYQQSAGLALYYNTANFYYLYVTASAPGRGELRLIAFDNRRYRDVLPRPVPISLAKPLEFKAVLNHGLLQFFFRPPGSTYVQIGPDLDATTLSDDYPVQGGIGLPFTGTFAALCAQDTSDLNIPADFDWFRYRSSPAEA